MLRNRSDQLGKNILRDLFMLGGDPRTEEEVPPGDAQRIDLWFVPDERRRHVLTDMKGIIAKMAEMPVMIELWSQPLRVRGFHASMRKMYDWHHALELRDKRKWPLPALWHLCARRVSALFTEFSLCPVLDGPAGLYRLFDRGFPVFVVVISELPRTRETLLLRLLGSPADRLAATLDLQDLEADAVEHQVAYEWLVRLQLELKKADPATLSNEEREFVMGAWLEERDRKITQHAVDKTRINMLRPLLQMRLGRELTRAELSVLRKRIRREEEPERLVVTIASQWTPAEVTAWLSAPSTR